MFRRERFDVLGEFIVAIDALLKERFVDPAFGDQDVGDSIEESQIGFGCDRKMLGRRHRRFGLPRIDHNDLGIVLVQENALPHDWMSNAQIGTDQNNGVGLFEIVVRVRWSIKAERLFVGNHGGCHTLASVSIAVLHTHAEFRQ